MNEIDPSETLAVHVRDQTLARLQNAFTHFSKIPSFDKSELTTDELRLCTRFDRQYETGVNFCSHIEASTLDVWVWLDWRDENIFCVECVNLKETPATCSICGTEGDTRFQGFMVSPDVRVADGQVLARPSLAIGYLICKPCEDASVPIKQRAEELNNE